MNNRIDTPTGPKLIRDLKIGDTVLSLNDDSKVVEDTVYQFINWTPVRHSLYVLVTFNDKTFIQLTPDHKLFDADGYEMRAQDLFGGRSIKNVRIGLLGSTHIGKVEYVENISGYASPLTYSGKYLVEGKLISNYTKIPHIVGHIWSLPMRIYTMIFGFNEKPYHGKHWYAQMFRPFKPLMF